MGKWGLREEGMVDSTHLNLSWCFASKARASGNSDLTGHRPIWSLTFLLSGC